MAEIFLGDRDLQDLLQEKRVSLKWEKPRRGKPVINIFFPVTEDAPSLRAVCSVCQKPATIDYTDEIDHRFVTSLGILVKKHNIGVYKVIGCEFSKMSDEDIEKGENDFMSSIDSPASKRWEEMLDSPCLNRNYVNSLELMSTVGLIFKYLEERFKKRQLSMRPPSFQQIQAALSGER